MTDRQKKTLAALVTAPTMKAAAKAAGVNYSTLRKWITTDKAFKDAYHAELAVLVEDAANQARQAMSEAMRNLREIANGGELESNRLAASKAVIESGSRLIELQSFETRLAELERVLAEDRQ